MQFPFHRHSRRLAERGQVNFVSFFRLDRYETFKAFKKRIMVATDIFGRGIDIERVNIVINYDMPDGSDTYLHRVYILVDTVGWKSWQIWNQRTHNHFLFC